MDVRDCFVIVVVATVHTLFGTPVNAEPLPAATVYAESPLHGKLNDANWRRIDASVDSALEYLARQQAADGSFPSKLAGQPAVTSLATMAFLSCGCRPGEGPYGDTLNRAIDYVLQSQEPSGLLASEKTRFPGWVNERRPHTATYNHAISGLMLGEVYGQANGELNKRLKPSIERAIAWARKMQQRPPKYREDVGGWRYLHIVRDSKPRSDLSATGWFVMFYRSARNAEFAVPEAYVAEAADFAARCFEPRSGAFVYGPHAMDRYESRGMTGAGLLVLTTAGRRDAGVARGAGDWLLAHPFDRYGGSYGRYDRFHYGAYYCSQAMYLLGGQYWAEFYPVLARTMLAHQRPDGGWPYETAHGDAQWGRSYSTALAVLALTPPYQLLPIYQR